MFKPGDVVIIKEPDDDTDGPGFVSGMSKYCGRKVLVEHVIGLDNEYDCDGGWYTIAGGDLYYFAGNWMEKVNKFKGNK